MIPSLSSSSTIRGTHPNASAVSVGPVVSGSQPYISGVHKPIGITPISSNPILGGLSYDQCMMAIQHQNYLPQGSQQIPTSINLPQYYDEYGNHVYYHGPLPQCPLYGQITQALVHPNQFKNQRGKPYGPQGQPYHLQGQPSVQQG